MDYRKEFITIDDWETYLRPRVQLHAKGIVLRDQLPGSLIKTKKQQVIQAGDLLVAEIDAKVGGFGIVPLELAGAIVSSHYFLFRNRPGQLDRKFLGWFIQTPAFRSQVEAQGSTNYAAIRPIDVLRYQIPLPSLEEQHRIVDKIENLARKVTEAQALRAQAAEELEAIIVSTHVALSNSHPEDLANYIELEEDVVRIDVGVPYPQAGVRGFGGGLFAKPPVIGGTTTYRSFNRLFPGALVMSQVKGWEGAVAVAPDDLVGHYVSPEYRTFRFRQDRCLPEYMAMIVPTEFFWGRLKGATRGVGARRERTRPEQFLAIKLQMPSIPSQRQALQAFERVKATRSLQAETAVELKAILPAILNDAFQGKL